ncbi:site-specific integrase [Polaribacter sp.]|uniref:site-specific integrase n=1 Tax=Polaribacter sp. TaxID=1920175 RepID=UPI0040483D2D
MPSINFIIRNKDSSKPTPISIKVLWTNRNELVYSTGIKVLPEHWDSKNQKIRNKLEVADVKDKINNKLSKIKSFTENTFTELRFNNKLSRETLKFELDTYFNKVSESKKVDSFFDYVENVLIEKSKKRVAKVTWQSYLRTLELLKLFQKEEKYKIDFETINMDFYFDFLEYLEDTIEMSPNTIGKQIKNIKMFMNTANEEGVSSCIGHKHKYFKVLREDSFQVYLNEHELKQIQEADYEFDSVNDRVRDLFLIGAYTGQRISDWNKLNENNIYDFNGIKCFKITQTKTKSEVIIPLHPIVKNIFNKRNFTAPKFVSKQKINDRIKNIAKKAKIKEKIKSKNGVEKHTLISSHTARRSYCSNAYKAGMDSIAIMKLSGHKTEQSFMKYIRIEKEEFASRIASHKFFQE